MKRGRGGCVFGMPIHPLLCTLPRTIVRQETLIIGKPFAVNLAFNRTSQRRNLGHPAFVVWPDVGHPPLYPSKNHCAPRDGNYRQIKCDGVGVQSQVSKARPGAPGSGAPGKGNRRSFDSLRSLGMTAFFGEGSLLWPGEQPHCADPQSSCPYPQSDCTDPIKIAA
jgi:hypothetical protein